MLHSTGVCLHEKSVIEDPETREGICTRCGTVVYEMEEAPCAAPSVEGMCGKMNKIKRHVEGWVGTHTTRINPVTKMGQLDANGQPCRKPSYYSRLRILNTQAYPRKQQYTQKCLLKGQYAIRRIAEKLHLSDQIIERAIQIYSRAVKAQLVRGRSIAGIVAAIIYMACKDCGTPRSAIEIKSFMEKESDKKRFFKDYQLVLSLREGSSSGNGDSAMQLMNVKAEIARVSSKISEWGSLHYVDAEKDDVLNHASLRLACDMYDKIKEKKPLTFDGKHPTCLAVALLYVAGMRIAAAGTNLTPLRQSAISYASGVSMVSLRNRYKGILKDLRDIGEIDEHDQNLLLQGHGSWKGLGTI